MPRFDIAAPLPDNLERLNVAYFSGLWDNALPSYVFVVPFIGTGEGFNLLHHVLNGGAGEMVRALDHLDPSVRGLHADTLRVEQVVAGLHKSIAKLTDKLDSPLEEERIIAEGLLDQNAAGLEVADAGFATMKRRLRKLATFHDLAMDVYDWLRICQKIALRLTKINDRHGRRYARRPRVVQKVTIAMKCLDYAWAQMRIAHKATRRASTAWNLESDYEFPFEHFVDASQ